MTPRHRFVSRLCSHTFLSYFLNEKSAVVDLGVNKGEFARSMIAKFGCRVHGLEPVPELFAAVTGTPGLIVEQAAIGTTVGTQQIRVFENRCASMGAALPGETSRSVDVPTVPLEVFLDRQGLREVDLLKVDIEGAELEMLPRIPAAVLAGIRQIAVEFHDFIYPETAPRVQAVIAGLVAAGFRRVRFSKDNIDLLFINPRFFRHPALLHLVLNFWFRPLLAMTRKIRRLFGNENPDHF